MTIIEKFNLRADMVDSLLCVGLDSALDYIPDAFQHEHHPQLAFNEHIIKATNEYVSAYKLNSAFYEARGDQGIHEMKLTVEYIQHHYPEIVVICDAKRGDTANTNKAYAEAVFDRLGFDAVTLNPYMGQESLTPFLQRSDKGCIILCRTSNPGAAEIQDLLVDGKPLWQKIAEKVVLEWNGNKNCMMVVGATYPTEMRMIRALAEDMTLLVPGIGEQGGNIEAVMRAGLNSQNKGLIINASRSIIFEAEPGKEAERLRNAINQYRGS